MGRVRTRGACDLRPDGRLHLGSVVTDSAACGPGRPGATPRGRSITVATVYAAAGAAAELLGHIIPAMCLVGLGMAFVVAPLSTAVMFSVGEARSGAATGINNAVTRMAGLISAAAAGSVVALLWPAPGRGQLRPEKRHCRARHGNDGGILRACLPCGRPSSSIGDSGPRNQNAPLRKLTSSAPVRVRTGAIFPRISSSRRPTSSRPAGPRQFPIAPHRA